jgi:hypothetical protein
LRRPWLWTAAAAAAAAAAVATAAAGPESVPQGGCPDPAASNYDPLSPSTPAALFNNSGCTYSCALLCDYFRVDCEGALCLIDHPGGPDPANWSQTNATLYATLGTTLIVQGRAGAAGSIAGRTQLSRRIESSAAGGATVILVRSLRAPTCLCSSYC